MASHNELGKAAEELAAGWLKSQGYEILHRNWRSGHHEIDIIAVRNGKLHVVEVKALQSFAKRFPEESVTRKKFSFLANAATAFLQQHPGFRDLQFDILSVTLYPDGTVDYFLIADVFL